VYIYYLEGAANGKQISLKVLELVKQSHPLKLLASGIHKLNNELKFFIFVHMLSEALGQQKGVHVTPKLIEELYTDKEPAVGLRGFHNWANVNVNL
jgi:hypothetical protein